MNAQIKKGILEMCILYLISQEDMYGYTLMKKMSVYFPNVNESTFYSILRRLNKDKATETYYGAVSNGPQRKYYKITDYGKQYLQNTITCWKKINDVVNDIGIS